MANIAFSIKRVLNIKLPVRVLSSRSYRIIAKNKIMPHIPNNRITNANYCSGIPNNTMANIAFSIKRVLNIKLPVRVLFSTSYKMIS